MRILHYTLGFPPIRTGGLTRYALDLMEEQLNENNQVFCLYPAVSYLVFACKLKKISKTKKNFNKIITYELFGGAPLVLSGSIRNPNDFMETFPEDLIVNFLQKLVPDVVHLHTIMGLPKEFIEVCNNLKIPIVYTTHDYFGISPNPTFLNGKQSFAFNNSSLNWYKCSFNSHSSWELRLYQLPLYLQLRILVRFIKSKTFPKKYLYLSTNSNLKKENLKPFRNLKAYYAEMFQKINFFIFNSRYSKKIYENNLNNNLHGCIIPVTNSSIAFKSNRVINNLINKNKIKLGYIAAYRDYKGFSLIINTFKRLDLKKFELHLFGDDQDIEINSKNIVNHGKFSINKIKQVYQDIDVLVVPSIWQETFGLTVLECLSQGKVVIVSNRVGSSMLLPDSFIFEPNIQSLETLIKKMLSQSIISEKVWLPSSVLNIKNQCQVITEKYRKLLSNGDVQ